MDEKNGARLTNALMHIAINGDASSRWKALSWINLFSGTSEVVRDVLATSFSEDLADVALNTSRAENINNEWVIGSQIILNLMKHEASFLKIDPELFAFCIETFADRINQPVAIIISSQMAANCGWALDPTSPDGKRSLLRGEDFNVGDFLDRNLSGEIGAKMLKQCVDDSVAPTMRPSSNTGATLTSIFLTSIIASGWSSLRWTMRFSSKGIVGMKAFHILRNMQTGRIVFTALIADMALQRVLRFASKEKFEFDLEKVKNSEENNLFETDLLSKPAEKINEALKHIPVDIPLSNVAPIFQNMLFGFTILALHSRRRFIVLPLLGAMAYNHRDYLESLNAIEYAKDVYNIVTEKTK